MLVHLTLATVNVSDLTALDHSDIPALLSLTEALEWTFTDADFRTMLVAGRLIGWRDAGRLDGVAGIFDFKTYASIGAVMIAPERQRMGLGEKIMRALHAQHPPAQPLVLIATPEGKPLYEKLGYRVTGSVHRLLAAANPDRDLRPPSVLCVRSLRPTHDTLSVLQLDRAATGGDRSALLIARLQQAEMGAVSCNAMGMPSGFVYSVRQRNQLILGPLVAPDDDVALELVQAILSTTDLDATLRIDIPHTHQSLLEPLGKLGFVEQDQANIMTWGANESPGYTPQLYALTAQAYG